MEKIVLTTSNATSTILVGQQLRSALEEFLQNNKGTSLVAVIDSAMAGYLDEILPACHRLVIPGGEAGKNLTMLDSIWGFFLANNVDRASTVVAVGGGAVTDLVAFAASTYHRGVPFILAPTTLLSQVDASIGGKNGVDYKGYKNIIGSITQPKMVICDLALLSTLSDQELSNGLAEIIKAGIIGDPELFSIVSNTSDLIFEKDLDVLEEIVLRSIKVKAGIVSRDERESGERMKLNLGHTLGHAVESLNQIPHGQAVAVGMVLEAKLAASKKICDSNLVMQIESILQKSKLPIASQCKADALLEAMQKDKKKRASKITFALPVAIGDVRLVEFEIQEIASLVPHLC